MLRDERLWPISKGKYCCFIGICKKSTTVRERNCRGVYADSKQGNVYLTRNGNWATFLPYVCNAKKELFYPTYDGITASVSLESLTLVVLNARWPDWLVRTQTQNAHRKQTNTNTVAFFQSESLPSNSFCSFDYARGNESIVYFTDLCKPIETYTYARKKHPIASYPAANHPKAANLEMYILPGTETGQLFCHMFVMQNGTVLSYLRWNNC